MINKILKTQRGEYFFKNRIRASYNVAMQQVREDDEVVDASLTISADIGKCILIITKERLIFAHKKIIGSTVKSISLKDISDIQMNKGLIYTRIEIDFLGDTQRLLGFNKSQGRLFKSINNLL